MTVPFDEAHVTRLAKAIYEAVLTASTVHIDGQPVAMIRNYDLSLALITVLADTVCSAEAVRERQAIAFVEKRLRAAIRAARTTGLPFATAARRPATVN